MHSNLGTWLALFLVSGGGMLVDTNVNVYI